LYSSYFIFYFVVLGFVISPIVAASSWLCSKGASGPSVTIYPLVIGAANPVILLASSRGQQGFGGAADNPPPHPGSMAAVPSKLNSAIKTKQARVRADSGSALSV